MCSVSVENRNRFQIMQLFLGNNDYLAGILLFQL